MSKDLLNDVASTITTTTSVYYDGVIGEDQGTTVIGNGGTVFVGVSDGENVGGGKVINAVISNGGLLRPTSGDYVEKPTLVNIVVNGGTLSNTRYLNPTSTIEAGEISIQNLTLNSGVVWLWKGGMEDVKVTGGAFTAFKGTINHFNITGGNALQYGAEVVTSDVLVSGGTLTISSGKAYDVSIYDNGTVLLCYGNGTVSATNVQVSGGTFNMRQCPGSASGVVVNLQVNGGKVFMSGTNVVSGGTLSNGSYIMVNGKINNFEQHDGSFVQSNGAITNYSLFDGTFTQSGGTFGGTVNKGTFNALGGTINDFYILGGNVSLANITITGDFYVNDDFTQSNLTTDGADIVVDISNRTTESAAILQNYSFYQQANSITFSLSTGMEAGSYALMGNASGFSDSIEVWVDNVSLGSLSVGSKTSYLLNEYELGVSNNNLIITISTAGASSPVVIYENDVPIFSGGSVANKTLDSTKRMLVASTGVATNTKMTGGTLFIANGATVNAVNLAQGSLTIVGGALSDTVQSGGIAIANGGTIKDYQIYAGELDVCGGTISALTIKGLTSISANADGGFVQATAGYMDNVTVTDNGELYVSAQADVNNLHVNELGCAYLGSGAVVNNIDVNYGGYLAVEAIGTAKALTITNEGYVYVAELGAVNGGTISSGGTLQLNSSACATDIEVAVGGGIVFDLVNGDKQLNITGHNVAGGNFSAGSGVASGFIIYDHGWGNIWESCFATDISLVNSGLLYVGTRASATDIDVGSTAMLWLGSGANVSNVNVSEGGVLMVDVIANAATVFSGKYDDNQTFLLSGGVASGFRLYGSAWQVVSGSDSGTRTEAVASDTQIYSGAMQNVLSHGTGYSAQIFNGGEYVLEEGGKAYGTIIHVGGSMGVWDDARAYDTTIDGGTLRLNNDAIHSGYLRGTSNGGKVLVDLSTTIDISLNTLSESGDVALVDYSLINGDTNYTLTIDTYQNSGTYKLMSNASKFNSTISVQNESGDFIADINVGGMFDYGTRFCTVKLVGDDLVAVVGTAQELTGSDYFNKNENSPYGGEYGVFIISGGVLYAGATISNGVVSAAPGGVASNITIGNGGTLAILGGSSKSTDTTVLKKVVLDGGTISRDRKVDGTNDGNMVEINGLTMYSGKIGSAVNNKYLWRVNINDINMQGGTINTQSGGFVGGTIGGGFINMTGNTQFQNITINGGTVEGANTTYTNIDQFDGKLIIRQNNNQPRYVEDVRFFGGTTEVRGSVATGSAYIPDIRGEFLVDGGNVSVYAGNFSNGYTISSGLLSFKTNANLGYSATINGMVDIYGGNIVTAAAGFNDVNAQYVFNLSGISANQDVVIDNYANMQSQSYTVISLPEQSVGEYFLIGNAAGFNCKITVDNGSETRELTVNGATVDFGGQLYTAYTNTDNKLVLRVGLPINNLSSDVYVGGSTVYSDDFSTIVQSGATIYAGAVESSGKPADAAGGTVKNVTVLSGGEICLLGSNASNTVLSNIILSNGARLTRPRKTKGTYTNDRANEFLYNVTVNEGAIVSGDGNDAWRLNFRELYVNGGRLSLWHGGISGGELNGGTIAFTGANSLCSFVINNGTLNGNCVAMSDVTLNGGYMQFWNNSGNKGMTHVDNLVVNGGVFAMLSNFSSGAVLNYAVVRDNLQFNGGTILMSGGSIALGVTMSGGIIDIKTDSTTAKTIAIVDGNIDMYGGKIVTSDCHGGYNDTNANYIFHTENLTGVNEAFIDDFTILSSKNFSVDVTNNPDIGEYKLIGNAESFGYSVSISCDGTSYGALEVDGDAITIGANKYSLKLADSTLVLAVTAKSSIKYLDTIDFAYGNSAYNDDCGVEVLSGGTLYVGASGAATQIFDGGTVNNAIVRSGGLIDVRGKADSQTILSDIVLESGARLTRDRKVDGGDTDGNHVLINNLTVNGGLVGVGGSTAAWRVNFTNLTVNAGSALIQSGSIHGLVQHGGVVSCLGNYVTSEGPQMSDIYLYGGTLLNNVAIWSDVHVYGGTLNVSGGNKQQSYIRGELEINGGNVILNPVYNAQYWYVIVSANTELYDGTFSVKHVDFIGDIAVYGGQMTFMKQDVDGDNKVSGAFTVYNGNVAVSGGTFANGFTMSGGIITFATNVSEVGANAVVNGNVNLFGGTVVTATNGLDDSAATYIFHIKSLGGLVALDYTNLQATNFTVDVADIGNGEYTFMRGVSASDFNCSVKVVDGDNTYGFISLGADPLDFGGHKWSLSVNDNGVLTLNVAKGTQEVVISDKINYFGSDYAPDADYSMRIVQNGKVYLGYSDVPTSTNETDKVVGGGTLHDVSVENGGGLIIMGLTGGKSAPIVSNLVISGGVVSGGMRVAVSGANQDYNGGTVTNLTMYDGNAYLSSATVSNLQIYGGTVSNWHTIVRGGTLYDGGEFYNSAGGGNKIFDFVQLGGLLSARSANLTNCIISGGRFSAWAQNKLTFTNLEIDGGTTFISAKSYASNSTVVLNKLTINGGDVNIHAGYFQTSNAIYGGTVSFGGGTGSPIFDALTVYGGTIKLVKDIDLQKAIFVGGEVNLSNHVISGGSFGGDLLSGNLVVIGGEGDTKATMVNTTIVSGGVVTVRNVDFAGSVVVNGTLNVDNCSLAETANITIKSNGVVSGININGVGKITVSSGGRLLNLNGSAAQGALTIAKNGVLENANLVVASSGIMVYGMVSNLTMSSTNSNALQVLSGGTVCDLKLYRISGNSANTRISGCVSNADVYGGILKIFDYGYFDGTINVYSAASLQVARNVYSSEGQIRGTVNVFSGANITIAHSDNQSATIGSNAVINVYDGGIFYATASNAYGTLYNNGVINISGGSVALATSSSEFTALEMGVNAQMNFFLTQNNDEATSYLNNFSLMSSAKDAGLFNLSINVENDASGKYYLASNAATVSADQTFALNVGGESYGEIKLGHYVLNDKFYTLELTASNSLVFTIGDSEWAKIAKTSDPLVAVNDNTMFYGIWTDETQFVSGANCIGGTGNKDVCLNISAGAVKEKDTTVFGGMSEAGNMTGDVNINFIEGEIGAIAGGAYNRQGSVGNIDIVVGDKGKDAILTAIYGGGFGAVNGDVDVKLGANAIVSAGVVAGGRIQYADKNTSGDVSLEICGGTISSGNIIGGNRVTNVANTISGGINLYISAMEYSTDAQDNIIGGGYVIGSGADYQVNGNIVITVVDTTLQNGMSAGCGMFGGAFAMDSATANVGEINITIDNSTVSGNIFGGGWSQQSGESSVGNVSISVDSSTVTNIFGGGAHSNVTMGGTTVNGNVKITVDNSVVGLKIDDNEYNYGSIYGRGQKDGDVVTGDATITLKNETVVGRVAAKRTGENDTNSTYLILDSFTGRIVDSIAGDIAQVTIKGDSNGIINSAEGVENWSFDLSGKTDDSACLMWEGGSFENDAIQIKISDESVLKKWTLVDLSESNSSENPAFEGTTFKLFVNDATTGIDIQLGEIVDTKTATFGKVELTYDDSKQLALITQIG